MLLFATVIFFRFCSKIACLAYKVFFKLGARGMGYFSRDILKRRVNGIWGAPAWNTFRTPQARVLPALGPQPPGNIAGWMVTTWLLFWSLVGVGAHMLH